MALFSETLIDDLNKLEMTFKALAHRLPEAGALMESSGRPVPQRLLRELAKSTQQFEEIKGEVLELTESVAGLPPRSEIGSINDLRSFMEFASDTIAKQTAHRNTQQAACGVLEKVLTITHVDNTEFAPLLECQAKARELHDSIAAAAWPDMHSEADSLAQGQHTFSELVKFVSFRDTLDDEEWERLQNLVNQSLGKPMGLAASRGKLIMPASAPPIPQVPVSVTPPETGTGPTEEIGQSEKMVAEGAAAARVENQGEDSHREETPAPVALTPDTPSQMAPETVGVAVTEPEVSSGPAPEPVGEPTPSAVTSTDQIPDSAAPEASGIVTAETTFDGTLDDIRYMLVLDLIDSKGIAKALSSKIIAASKAAVGGDTKTAAGFLKAFIEEVNAETGKHISGAAPQLLLSDANRLLNQLQ